jgi:hypothetical protein
MNYEKWMKRFKKNVERAMTHENPRTYGEIISAREAGKLDDRRFWKALGLERGYDVGGAGPRFKDRVSAQVVAAMRKWRRRETG